MKLKLTATLFLLLPCIVYSQKQTRIYYDIEWKGTDSSNAAYYRLATLDSSGRAGDTVRDFFVTGELHRKGLALYIDRKDDSKSKWMGLVTSFYKSGVKKVDAGYNAEGKLDGAFTSYYESGKIKVEGDYKNGAVIGKFYKKWTEFGYGTKEFEDHFSNGNVYDWPLNTNERHSCKIVNDSGLEMSTFTAERGVAQALSLPLDLHKNYEIDATFDYKNGDDTLWHGIIWGFSDWDNFNFFYICADGYYRIGSFKDGFMRLARESYSSYIHKGYDRNKLLIVSSDRITRYTINRIPVVTTEAHFPIGNYIGFYILRGKQKVLFENLHVGQRLDTAEDETTDTTKIWQDPSTKPSYATDGNEFKGWRCVATGFFVDPAGYIVTNYKVVADVTDIEVDAIQGGDRVFLKAKIISVDKQNDLAVLKIIDDKFIPLKSLPYNFKTETSDVATDVFTLGFPQPGILGTEVKFTDGKISSKTGVNGGPECYQVSVPIQPGNAGGPLYDYDGNLIGIVSTKNTMPGEQSVTYAIKSSYLRTFLETLPEKFNLPHDAYMANKPLTEKIKVLTNYVVMIKVK